MQFQAANHQLNITKTCTYVAEFNLLRISIAQNNKLVTLRIEDVVGASRVVDWGKDYVFCCKLCFSGQYSKWNFEYVLF